METPVQHSGETRGAAAELRRQPRRAGEYVTSSPHFFRLIKRACGVLLASLLLLAAVVPAPLLTPADPASPPNPAKSAWFLLWTQELVSHGTALAWLITALAVWFFSLPWCGRREAPVAAVWFGRERWLTSWGVLAAFAAIIVLTVVAMFFRGENWSLVSPF